jgi:2-methylisocitrate lyase-like PEP mutase family enzyme
MAAHNPLAAKLAAQAGFDAIWGSGFELSAAYAVPDASILSVDTHLELMRAIGEVQDAPVIADLDTGYGNAVNVAYLVPRYAAAGVAAVVPLPKLQHWARSGSSSVPITQSAPQSQRCV